MNKAFELILERLDESSVCEDGRTCNYCQRNWCPKILVEREEVEKIVQEVAQEYNDGWIPCSERLPEADENVLTCSEYGFITVSSCNDAGEFSSYADEYCIKYPKPKVIAWQPIPEPYQPEGE